MKEAARNTRLLRSMIFENLFAIQKGIYSFRNTGNCAELKECFRQAFGRITETAESTGHTEVSNFCQCVLDLCKSGGWTDMRKCFEVFRLVNSGIDWMLLYADPELITFGQGQRLTRHESREMLFDLKRQFELIHDDNNQALCHTTVGAA